MLNNLKRYMGTFFVIILFSMLTVTIVDAEEKEQVLSESNIVLNDYMKNGYF